MKLRGEKAWCIEVTTKVSVYYMEKHKRGSLGVRQQTVKEFEVAKFGFFGFWFVFGCATRLAGILVPRPGIKPMPPALGARSLNHWTAREVPGVEFGDEK